MTVYAVVNQKGGVGKTTTAQNVGAGLAIKGKRVLLIDLDPSGNLTTGAGVKIGEGDPTIYEVIKGTADINDAIRPAQGGNYDIVPADSLLSGATVELSGVPGRELILKEAVEVIKAPYDYIFIDCPRALDTLSIMGLTAAQAAIVPVQAHYYALDGIAQLKETVDLIKKRMNPALQIGGVLITMYDPRKVANREVLESVRQAFPDTIYKTTIGNYTALAEAPSFGKDIFTYKAKDKGAAQYMELVNEIIKREVQK